MFTHPWKIARLGFVLLAAVAATLALAADGDDAPPPVPDKIVVLTFDDSVATQATFVAPLLKQHGFGATFFITEGFDFAKNKKQYMT